MTAVGNNTPDLYRKRSYEGAALDIPNATIKAMIVTNSWTPNQNTDEFIDDGPNANEVSGTNYTAGGNACANPIVSMDGSGNIIVDTDDPASYAQNAGGFADARRTVFYDDTGTPSTSPILSYSNAYASDQGNVAGAFASSVNVSGLINDPRPS